MTEEKKKNILSAIDKMESESVLRAQENRKARVIEKHIIKKEIQEVEKVKDDLIQEQKDLRAYEVRANAIFYSLGSVLSMIVVWNLSREQRTTFIEYGIIVILCAGMVAAKKK